MPKKTRGGEEVIDEATRRREGIVDKATRRREGIVDKAKGKLDAIKGKIVTPLIEDQLASRTETEEEEAERKRRNKKRFELVGSLRSEIGKYGDGTISKAQLLSVLRNKLQEYDSFLQHDLGALREIQNFFIWIGNALASTVGKTPFFERNVTEELKKYKKIVDLFESEPRNGDENGHSL